MSFSDFMENTILNEVFGGVNYAPPGTLYVALYTTAPDDAGAGGTEVSGGAYARVAVTNNATNWPAALGGAKSNGVAVTFPQATAAWGTVVAWAVWDAATGGNMIDSATLSASKTVQTGDTPVFGVGDLKFSLS
ncbi:MAG: hypothetical protein M3Q49_19420 [Actinomycetota bacterium]|nr:hypothetical protein [Actinomycetota bacterium]